ncbi:hypothetical protein ACTFIY_002273 [Dictyostelium cf. discoideum]
MENFQNHKEEIKKYQFQIQKLQDQLLKKDIIIEELNQKYNEVIQKKWKTDFHKDLLICFEEEFISFSKEKKRLNSIIGELKLKQTDSQNSQPIVKTTPVPFNSKKSQPKTFELKILQSKTKLPISGTINDKTINNQQHQHQHQQQQKQQKQQKQKQQQYQQYFDKQLDIEKDIEECGDNGDDDFEDYEEGLLNQIELDSM